MGFLSVLALFAVTAYVIRQVNLGQAEPDWSPSPVLRIVMTILGVAWQLLRAWYVLIAAFFGVVILVGAYRLYDNGSMFEAVAFCGGGVLLLVSSFRWFAIHSDWRHPQHPPTRAEYYNTVLEVLRDAGYEVGTVLPIEFRLCFGTEVAARKAAATGATGTLAAQVTEDADAHWLLDLAGTIILTPSVIEEHDSRFKAIASSLGGSYSGWKLVDAESKGA